MNLIIMLLENYRLHKIFKLFCIGSCTSTIIFIKITNAVTEYTTGFVEDGFEKGKTSSNNYFYYI